MPVWSGNKVNPAELNDGNEWDESSQVAIEELNAMVNGGLYAQTFAEALTDTPDNTDADNVGTASVSLVDNIKNGKVYKKFKFSNLKGEKGDEGPKGDKGDTGPAGGTFTLGNFLSYINLDPKKTYVKFNATSGLNRVHVLGHSNLYIDKGDGTPPFKHSSGDYVDVNYDNSGIYMISFFTLDIGVKEYVRFFVDNQDGKEKYLELYIGDNCRTAENTLDINQNAFRGCSNLAYVRIIARGNAGIISVGISSFESCGVVKVTSDTRRILYGSQRSFKNAFSLAHLDNIWISQSSFTRQEIFYNCTNLPELFVAEYGDYYIGENAFGNCLIRVINFLKDTSVAYRNRVIAGINASGKVADNALITY